MGSVGDWRVYRGVYKGWGGGFVCRGVWGGIYREWGVCIGDIGGIYGGEIEG